jgi:pimeloyl-ACP methyl ester carboxylesterase
MSTTAARRRFRLDIYGPRPDATADSPPDPYGNPDPEWMGIDWRRHLGTVEVDGTPVNYVDLGPPEREQHPLALVFVHGLGGCWQNWLEQLPLFSRRHRVIALDLPGFGHSPEPQWEISIPNYGRLLQGFCDALDVRDAALVGNSMGGFIATEAVITQPRRFEKLVLISAAGVSSARLRRAPTSVVARMLAAASPYLFRIQERSFHRPRAREAAFRNVFRRPLEIRPELLWEFFGGAMAADGFAEALVALAGYDFTDRLDDVEVPTLVVWGRNDNVVPPRDALEFGRLLRNSRTVIYDECGHVPMAERPVRFNRELEAFLAEPESGPDVPDR